MSNQGRTEIQLGHMCNNRCVFCVSGQRTERRQALPLLADPILGRIKELKEAGGRQLTFVGGEPTLQPSFLSALRYAVALGFEEVIVHTNGVKTARASFVDEILACGGNINFRLSFQGGTREAHERTTQKVGSFDRLVQSLENISARGRRISINLCLVETNYESIAGLPELLRPYPGVWQVHLDLMRPLDAGERTEDELRAMIPLYSRMTPFLEQMVAGFPDEFDVNIGNLPFCIAPSLSRYIHHDGERTFTVAADGDGLSQPWDKYENKKRDKLKTERCASCVFDSQCSGFFETYRDLHGTDEFVPVQVDPRLAGWVKRLEEQRSFGPLVSRGITLSGDGQAAVLLLADGRGGEVEVTLEAKQERMAARYRLRAGHPSEELRSGLQALFGLLKNTKH